VPALRPLVQEARELRRRHRSADQKALRAVAFQIHEALELLARLDAFCDDVELQAVRQLDDASHDAGGSRIPCHAMDERAIDLELIERQTTQVAQRRISRAEIVDRYRNAEHLKLPEHVDRRLAVVKDDALGDLELQSVRCKSLAVQDAREPFDELWAMEMQGGDVDRDPERRDSGAIP